MRILKYAETERRKNEMAEYGRLLSLRPSISMTNKKKYNRKKLKRIDYDSI